MTKPWVYFLEKTSLLYLRITIQQTMKNNHTKKSTKIEILNLEKMYENQYWALYIIKIDNSNFVTSSLQIVKIVGSRLQALFSGCVGENLGCCQDYGLLKPLPVLPVNKGSLKKDDNTYFCPFSHTRSC